MPGTAGPVVHEERAGPRTAADVPRAIQPLQPPVSIRGRRASPRRWLGCFALVMGALLRSLQVCSICRPADSGAARTQCRISTIEGPAAPLSGRNRLLVRTVSHLQEFPGTTRCSITVRTPRRELGPASATTFCHRKLPSGPPAIKVHISSIAKTSDTRVSTSPRHARGAALEHDAQRLEARAADGHRPQCHAGPYPIQMHACDPSTSSPMRACTHVRVNMHAQRLPCRLPRSPRSLFLFFRNLSRYSRLTASRCSRLAHPRAPHMPC